MGGEHAEVKQSLLDGRARLLAIRDTERQHFILVRYFRRLGFKPERCLGAGLLDLPLRLVWGGSGLLMSADCQEGLERASRLIAHTVPRHF